MNKSTLSQEASTRYLNLDLDVRVRSGLSALVAAFEPGAVILKQTRTFACLELNKQPKTADATVLAFAKLIQQLPRPARKIWNSCSLRSMNIGIQSADAPHSKPFKLSNRALAAAAACGCDVVFTIYAPHKTARAKSKH